MRILLSGGCQSGKSVLAQQLTKKLAGDSSLYYLATMEPIHEDDFLYIAQCRLGREGWGYETVESSKQLHDCFQRLTADSAILVDSITALFANEMFTQNKTDRNAAWRTAEELRCLGDRCAHVVYLTDNIFCDASRYDPETEDYRKGLAQVNRILAEQCDAVAEVYYGFPIVYKGDLP